MGILLKYTQKRTRVSPPFCVKCRERGGKNVNEKLPARAAGSGAPNWFQRNKKTLALLSMVAPGAIWLLLLRYLPIGGIILAFKNYKIFPRNPTFWSNLQHSKWVGLKNFEFLFKTDQALVAIRNTLLYNIVFIILGCIIPVAFAIMMNEFTKKFVAKAYQTMMFFPYFLSWVVVSYFLNAFIDAQYGMIPAAQAAAGKEVISWYTNTKPWPAIIIIANLWKTWATRRCSILRPSRASTPTSMRPRPSTAPASGSRSATSRCRICAR